MVTSRARPVWRGRALALIGILLVAANLRTAVASLSPIVEQISAEIPLSPLLIGLIGTAPPVCFAVFGMVAPRFARRVGLERLLIIALAALTLGLLMRGLAPNFAVLFAATTVAFAAIGTGNVLLPPLVKKYFPDRVGLMTTSYVTVMTFSTFIPPLIAVPVADAAGWRISLGLWAAVAAVAVVPWIALLVHPRSGARVPRLESPDPAVVGRLWRSPLAWSLAIVFAGSSVTAYTMFAWMPTMLIDIAGVRPHDAGTLVAVFVVVALPWAIAVPLIAGRRRVIGWLIGFGIAATLIGYAGLLFAPAAAPFLWVGLVGMVQLQFPLALVLINLRTRTHDTSVALSGFVQSVGYAVTAFAPLVVSLLFQATGSWTVPLVLLACVVLAGIPAGIVVARPGTIEDESSAR